MKFLSKRYSLLGLLLLTGITAFAQSRITFDRNGRKSAESLALYYRASTPDSAGVYRAYYINGNALYFEGEILTSDHINESLNTYTGTCSWYYKNGNRMRTSRFNQVGLKDGLEEEYHENGNIKKEVNFTAGKQSRGPYQEYSDTGEKSTVLEENFEDNYNDWDLYASAISSARIKNKSLELTALTKEGTSRFISFPKNGETFTFEAEIENVSEKKGRYGLILGFKDWENFSYFLISDNYFYLGTVFEGLNINYSDGSYVGSINAEGKNTLKILSSGDKTVFSVNGELVFRKEVNFSGNKFGFMAGDKQKVIAHKLIWKEIGVGAATGTSDQNVKFTGTGFFLSSNGLLVTNHHVVEGQNQFIVEMQRDGATVAYKAKVVNVDKSNDLAILKIEDPTFTSLPPLSYSIKTNGLAEVGSSVFTLGYPHALGGMGKEVKFSDGKISSKTGYNQDINSYQTTVPIQPGNSGGPLFDANGQLVGVMNAKFKQGDNVSYAIKSNYLLNLIDLINEKANMPTYNFPAKTSTELMVKNISPMVVLIKVK